jgi:hypothetical protein
MICISNHHDRIIALAILLCFGSVFINAYGINDVSVFSNSFRDRNGFFHIIGEIKNLTPNPIMNVTVTANIIDESNQSISNQTRFAELRTIKPLYFSPFEIIIYEPQIAKNVRNYTLKIDYNHTETQKEAALQIERNSSRLDITGNYFIYGNIKNNGKNESKNTNIIAIFYEQDGKIVGVGRGQSEPYDIPAGTSAGFGIVFPNPNLFLNLKYKIIAESLNYSS